MILSKEYIKQAITDFFKDKPVSKVWLFGSYARGEADENSDVDVLIDVEKNKKLGMQYFLWNEDWANKLNKKVDIVSHAWVNKHLKPFIDEDKLIIYEK